MAMRVAQKFLKFCPWFLPQIVAHGCRFVHACLPAAGDACVPVHGPVCMTGIHAASAAAAAAACMRACVDASVIDTMFQLIYTRRRPGRGESNFRIEIFEKNQP